MADPTSWLSIEPGWKVVAADGSDVGEVNLVTGDETHDIFNGLAIAPTALGKPRYVAAEQVAEIREGVVHLSLGADEARELPDYLEPATSAVILTESRGGTGEAIAGAAREVEGAVMAPITRQRPPSIWRRMGLLLRRKIG